MLSAFQKLSLLDRRDPRPLYAQLKAILTRCIQQNRLPPGTPLPTENELIKRFYISRITVRQAIQELETEGLVNKVQGRGTFVAHAQGRNQFRFFSSIEPWSAKQGLYVTNKVLKNGAGRPANWAVDLGYPPDDPAWIIKRLKTMGKRLIAWEHRVMPTDVAACLTADDIRNKPIFDALAVSSTIQLCKISYNLSAILAAGEDARLLRCSPGAALMVRTGIYRSRDERPIMASRVAFIADGLDLSFEFHREEDYWRIINVT